MADVIGRRYSGNLAYVDRGAHLKRFISAIGPDVIQYVEDFVDGPAADTDFDNRWTVTRVEAGSGESTVTRTDEAGGALLITTDDAENDGINMQLLGESFKLSSSSVNFYFGIRAKMSEATQSDFFFGLAITDTDVLGGVTDSIGFEKVDGSTAVKFDVNKNSTLTQTGTLSTLETTLYHIYEFAYINGTLEVFIDGASVATPALTNLPDDEELRVTLQLLAGSAAARTCKVDWIRAIQIGGRAS